jgi:hypothetical protein
MKTYFTKKKYVLNIRRIFFDKLHIHNMLFNSIKHIQTRNCGGYGAWMDNPLSSPSPGPEIWPGFQIGGGIRRKYKRSKKSLNSRRTKKYKLQKSLRRYKKTRRNI